MLGIADEWLKASRTVGNPPGAGKSGQLCSL